MSGIFPHSRDPIPPPQPWWQVVALALSVGTSFFIVFSGFAYLVALLFWPRGM